MWSMSYVRYHKGGENTLFSVYRQKRMNTGNKECNNNRFKSDNIYMKKMNGTVFFFFFHSMEDCFNCHLGYQV